MKAWTGGVLLADKLRAGVSRATAASGSAPKTEEKKDGKKPDKKNLETAPKDDPAVAPKEPVATEKNTSGAVPATASPQAVEATPSVEQKSKVAEPPTVATSHEALNPAATVDAAPAESTATVFKAPAAAAVAITFSKELDVLLVPNRRAEVFKLFAESAKPVPAPAPQQVSAAPIQTAPQQVSAAPIQTAPASAMTSAPAPTPTSTAAQQQQQQPVASHAFHPSQSHYQQSHYQQSHYQQSHHQRQHYARQQQQQPPQPQQYNSQQPKPALNSRCGAASTALFPDGSQTELTVHSTDQDNSSNQPVASSLGSRYAQSPSKKDIDPGRPKRPMTAYNFFFKEERTRMLGDEQDSDLFVGTIDSPPVNTVGENYLLRRQRKRRPHRKISFEELARSISQKWKNIDPERLKKYQTLAQQDKDRYNREKEKYFRNNPERELEKNSTRPSTVKKPRATKTCARGSDGKCEDNNDKRRGEHSIDREI